MMLSKAVLKNMEHGSAIRAMFEEGTSLKKIYGDDNVYDFSIGNPDPEPPAETLLALQELLSQRGIHGYMSNAGYMDVRGQMAAHLNKSSETKLSADNIVMTCGAGGGMNVVLKAIMNPGDEVIIFAPYFMEYSYYIENHGGHKVTVPTDSNTFMPDFAALEKSITPATKAIILNTPHNPTGVVYGQKLLEDMANVIEKRQREMGCCIFMISDEPYREIVYDDTEVPSVLDIFENAIVVYSFSKSLSLPGERIGYIAASSQINNVQTLVDAMIFANRALGFVNAPSLFQRAVAMSIGSMVDVSIYKQRRDMLYNHLTSLGFHCIKPQGAFYLFPRSPLEDVNRFKQLALEHRIVLVPGAGFGAPQHFRLAYCVDIDMIWRSLPAFTALAKDAGL